MLLECVVDGKPWQAESLGLMTEYQGGPDIGGWSWMRLGMMGGIWDDE
jgi:hypothetical protein